MSEPKMIPVDAEKIMAARCAVAVFLEAVYQYFNTDANINGKGVEGSLMWYTIYLKNQVDDALLPILSEYMT